MFFKFPSTPHLSVLGGHNIREDKVLTPSERHKFLRNSLTVEEKLDGSNLGLSFDEHGALHCQSRGNYLPFPFTGQWKLLNNWAITRTNRLFDELTTKYILFGEWCYAKHSIFYNRLPDWFLGFDIFDKRSKEFLCEEKRNEMFRKMDISSVPTLSKGSFSISELTHFCREVSCFGQENKEGIYLRFDHAEFLGGRAKIVRGTFTQQIEEHWLKKPIVKNLIV